MTKEERKVYNQKYWLEKKNIIQSKKDKENISEYNKKYREENREILKIYNKNYKKENREEQLKYFQTYNEEHKNYQIEYYQNNKSRINKRNKQRYHSDPIFKSMMILRIYFYQFVKKGIKHKSVLNLLNCNLEEFKQYIEKQFINGMTWENHGKVWEYDHKEPVSSFNPNIFEDHKKCWNYKNFMPRFKTTDISEQFNSDQIGNRNKSNKLNVNF